MVLNFSSMTFSLKLIYKKEKFDTYNTYIQKGFQDTKIAKSFRNTNQNYQRKNL